jgi:lysyl-tRNA synthetase class 2
MDPVGLRRRAAVLGAVRDWMRDRGFREVPTPTIVSSPALEEHLYAVPVPGGFLRTSPEFALKRVAAAGLCRIYEIGPSFRERESGPWHGREFTMLEWYRAGGDIPDLMGDVEQIVAAAARAVGVTPPVFERWTVDEAFRRLAGVALADLEPRPGDDWDTAFFRVFLEQVEPKLPPAVFLRDWPASQAALAQVRTDGAPRTCRVEAYLNGVELANGFLEVIDSDLQRRRFEEAADKRRQMGDVPHPTDAALIAAVGRMPPTAGIALGVDRLVAALSGWRGIGPGRAASVSEDTA